MKQIICKSEENALIIANKLAETEDYVAVIESKGKFYVENEASMIRNWERIVKEFEK